MHYHPRPPPVYVRAPFPHWIAPQLVNPWAYSPPLEILALREAIVKQFEYYFRKSVDHIEKLVYTLNLCCLREDDLKCLLNFGISKLVTWMRFSRSTTSLSLRGSQRGILLCFG